MLRTFKLALAAIVALNISASLASAAKPPKNPPPPPPPPPVTYALKFFEMPTSDPSSIYLYSYTMTSQGVVVGYFIQNNVQHPFIYDASIDPDVAINPNDLAVVGLPAGWRIVTALDINEQGYVVGAIEEISNPGFWRGYMLDLGSTPPLLTTFPDGPNHTYARGINDNMDIVGVTLAANGYYQGYVYNPVTDTQITNLGFDLVTHNIRLSKPLPGYPAQVTGWRASNYAVFRYTIGTGQISNLFLTNPDTREAPQDISSTGVVCGGYPKPRTKNGFYAFRFDTELETLPAVGIPTAINAHGDLAVNSGPSLYHEGTGLIDLTATLTGSAGDLTRWNAASSRYFTDMTERGEINSNVPNFPGLCGSVYEYNVGSRAFVLIPIAGAP